METVVLIRAAERVLQGMVRIPEDPAGMAVIIPDRFKTRHDRKIRGLADHLWEKGWGSLAADLLEEEEGMDETAQNDGALAARRVELILRWLEEQPWRPAGKPLLLVGLGANGKAVKSVEGATALAIASEEGKTEIDRVIQTFL